jgi:hypothetical protein
MEDFDAEEICQLIREEIEREREEWRREVLEQWNAA